MTRNGGFTPHNSCQFFQIHASKSKRCFHFHALVTNHIRVSESVVFFSSTEDPFNCFLTLVVEFLHSSGMSYIFRSFHVVFPNMSGNQFHMVFALSTLRKVWAVFTYVAAAFVFPVPIAICCTVFQNFVCRTEVAIVVFIVNIFIFAEEPILGHWPLVRK